MIEQTVGFIGLGIMGGRNCDNLLAAGVNLVVHDQDSAAVGRLVDAGAKAATTPREVAESSDVVLLSLPDTPQVEAVTFGEDGLIHGSREGQTIVDLSSVAPTTPQRIAAQLKPRGLSWLDAPVSGGPAGAAAGSLTIMVGGDEEVLASVRPILEIIGGRVEYMGGSGMGATTKSINQLAIGIQMMAMAEAFTVGTKAGIPAKRLYEVLSTSTSRCWVMTELVKNIVLENDFDNPRFAIRLIAKDMRIAAQYATELKVPAAATALSAQMFSVAEGLGWGGMDQMAVMKLFGNATGIDEW
ncbi:NAD(P)-dependent oxidoreductase [Mycolicibacterium palauense]|uniref:NAD(P)-dependent oxidoreductase n=1 Tax=Mycolicibacterium palauense TaxID=2034511 RepID=UPI000BFEEF94|nr:NAD(P)-dependent oxidoreductase [Mycolicibacterium palauense]